GHEAEMLKPQFLLGDALMIQETKFLRLKEAWLIENSAYNYFIPSTERHLPLSVFRGFSEARRMEWNLTPNQAGLLAGHFKLDTHARQRDTFVAVRESPSCSLYVLLPGHLLHDYTPSETPFGASTFCNKLA
ncbi:hypothetical protein ACDT16_13870, partial [Staphylococcus aureus]